MSYSCRRRCRKLASQHCAAPLSAIVYVERQRGGCRSAKICFAIDIVADHRRADTQMLHATRVIRDVTVEARSDPTRSDSIQFVVQIRVPSLLL